MVAEEASLSMSMVGRATILRRWGRRAAASALGPQPSASAVGHHEQPLIEESLTDRRLRSILREFYA